MRYIFSLMILLLLFSSTVCAEIQSEEKLSGMWISEDYLIAAQKRKQLKTIQKPPFFEFSINAAEDSVIYSNGFENITTALQKKQHYFLIENHIVTFDTNQRVLLIKERKSNKVWHFTQSNKKFSNVLNAITVAGRYQNNIQFFEDGRVSGLKGFDRYNICYAGDCEAQNTTHKNILMLSDQSGKQTWVAWQITPQHSLILYQLKNTAAKGDMPEYKEQKKWMELFKTK